MATKEVIIVVKARNEASRTFRAIQLDLGKIAGTNMGPLIGGIMRIGKVAAAAAVGGIAALTVGVLAFAKASLDSGQEFEQAMANAAAIMEKPIESMGELRALALDTAIDPRFRVTAIEAAGAIEMLARNGVDATDILNGMLEGTILLANSVGTDLSLAADIATDALNIFGMEASEMVTAVNSITGVVNNSKFTIDDYFLALGRAGASLAPLGGSFDDFNTTLALIAPFFNSGQRAGTSMANFFNRLIPTTNKAKEAMLALGMASSDEETGRFINNFINPDTGSIHEMVKVIEVLQKSLGRLTAEKQQEAILQIFGRDAQGAVAAILKFGHEFTTMQESVLGTDAFAAAETRMGTLAAATHVLQGFFERLRIETADLLLPALTFLAIRMQGLVGVIIDHVSPAFSRANAFMEGFFDTVGKAPFTFDLLTRALFTGGVAADMNKTKLMDIYLIMRDIRDISESPTFRDGTVLAMESFLPDDLLAQGLAFIAWLDETKLAIENFVKSDAGQRLIKILEFIGLRIAVLAGLTVLTSIFAALVGVLSALVTPLGLVATAIAILVVAWKDNWGNIQTHTQTAVDEVILALGALKTWFDTDGQLVLGTLEKMGSVSMVGLSTLAEGLTDGVMAFFSLDNVAAAEAIIGAIDEVLVSGVIADRMRNLMSTLWQQTFGPMWEETVAPEIDAFILDWQENWPTKLAELFAKLGEITASMSVLNIVGAILAAIFPDDLEVPPDIGRNFFQSVMDAFIVAVSELDMHDIWNAIVTVFTLPATIASEITLGPFIAGFAGKMADDMEQWDWLPAMLTLVNNLLFSLIEALIGLDVEPVITAFADFIVGLFDPNTSLMDKLKKGGEELLEGIILGFLNHLITINDRFVGFFTAIADWFNSPERDWEQFGRKLMTAILDAIDFIIAAPSAIGNAVGGLWDGLVSWFEDPAQEWEKLGIGTASEILESLKNHFTAESIKEAMWTFVDAIVFWFASPERPWKNIGKSVGVSILEGIKEALGALGGALDGIISGAMSAIQERLGHNTETGSSGESGAGQPPPNTRDNRPVRNTGLFGPVAVPVTAVSAPTRAFSAIPSGRDTVRVEYALVVEEDLRNVNRIIDESVGEFVQRRLSDSGRRVNLRRRSGV